LVNVESRLEELERNGHPKRERRHRNANDPLSVRILEFLSEYPGLKFNQTTLAASLDQEKAHPIGYRLKKLEKEGKIQSTRRELNKDGQPSFPLYYVPKSDVSEEEGIGNGNH
jgi:hypothetical protein